MFVIALWIYHIVNTEFLAPNPKALDTLGWKDAHKIKKRGQVWRFITPVFLHASFAHLCLNLLSTIVIGSGLENGLGSWKLCTLYFVSSFGGVLFSCVFNPLAYSVGASTAIFGLIGYYVSELFLFLISDLDCLFMHRMDEARRVKSDVEIYFAYIYLNYLTFQYINCTY